MSKTWIGLAPSKLYFERETENLSSGIRQVQYIQYHRTGIKYYSRSFQRRQRSNYKIPEVKYQKLSHTNQVECTI